MSVQRRKLSYWSIDFLSGDKHSFDSALFCRFLSYVGSLNDTDRLFREKCGNYWYNQETAKLRQFLNYLFGVSKPCRVFPCGFLFIKRRICWLAIRDFA